MRDKLYRKLASTVEARLNCAKRNDWDVCQEWHEKHTDAILALVKEHMPSGSGFDSGTMIDLDESHAEKLVFHTSYHHMNDGGMYDGWTEHSVTVTPSLAHGFDLKVGGRDRNEIKDYIEELFHECLGREID